MTLSQPLVVYYSGIVPATGSVRHRTRRARCCYCYYTVMPQLAGPVGKPAPLRLSKASRAICFCKLYLPIALSASLSLRSQGNCVHTHQPLWRPWRGGPHQLKRCSDDGLACTCALSRQGPSPAAKLQNKSKGKNKTRLSLHWRQLCTSTDALSSC